MKLMIHNLYSVMLSSGNGIKKVNEFLKNMSILPWLIGTAWVME